MLIRTQNKKQSVNFDKYNGLAIYYQPEVDFGVCAVLEIDAENVSHVLLGNYSSEEKALDVMNMIEEYYSYLCRFPKEAIVHVLDDRLPHIKSYQRHYGVFQMPEDNYNKE